MRSRRRGSLIIGVSILLVAEERQGLPKGGSRIRQANRLRSCKAAVCFHDCRQPLSEERARRGGGCAGSVQVQ